MNKRRYYALCRDSVSGMEFDFELDSTNLRAAREEADCKYNGVVFVGARVCEGEAGVDLKTLKLGAGCGRRPAAVEREARRNGKLSDAGGKL